MLHLTRLTVLGAVARQGSVTEAARALHYSQPSVSYYLGRLEAATGAKLILVVGRGIRLTPEAELLAQRATDIRRRLNAASVELAARVGLRAGRVRLAGFQTVLSTLIPKAAGRMARLRQAAGHILGIDSRQQGDHAGGWGSDFTQCFGKCFGGLATTLSHAFSGTGSEPATG